MVVETGFLRDRCGLRRWVANGLGIVKLNLKGAQTVTPVIKRPVAYLGQMSQRAMYSATYIAPLPTCPFRGRFCISGHFAE